MKNLKKFEGKAVKNAKAVKGSGSGTILAGGILRRAHTKD